MPAQVTPSDPAALLDRLILWASVGLMLNPKATGGPAVQCWCKVWERNQVPQSPPVNREDFRAGGIPVWFGIYVFLTTELPSSKSPFFEPWWESHIFISKWSGSLRGKFWPQTLVQENFCFPAASPVLTASLSLSSSGPHTALPDSLSGGCVPVVPGWFELGTPHPAPGWVPDCGGQYGAFTT